MRSNVARALRALRRRRGWRQVDLARRAGVSRDLVQRAEGRRLGGVTVRALDRLASALDAGLAVDIRWHGAELDRLIDARHAALAELAARRLERLGWAVYPEVSFNHFGDRGRCDLVGWRPPARALLVVEIKTSIGDLQEALGRFDVKLRLAGVIASQLRLGRPTIVAGALVLTESGANRRLVRRHAALFRRFRVRGRQALAWIRRPVRVDGSLLWFE